MSSFRFEILRREIQIDSLLADIETFRFMQEKSTNLPDTMLYKGLVEKKEQTLKECRTRLKEYKKEMRKIMEENRE